MAAVRECLCLFKLKFWTKKLSACHIWQNSPQAKLEPDGVMLGKVLMSIQNDTACKLHTVQRSKSWLTWKSFSGV